MIDRFNFYDVYAYLIPGFVLLIVLWLPFGLTGTGWPDADVASALVGLVTAYVLGHVLHVLSQASIPVKIDGRFPSDLVLEGKGRHFSPVLAEGVRKAIGVRYGLDLFDRSGPEPDSSAEAGRPSGAESTTTEHHRWDALQLCRDALVREGLGKYAEQFQGMYALLRGIAAAAILGGLSQTGWLLGHLSPLSSDTAGGILSVGWATALLAAFALTVWYLVYQRPAWSLWFVGFVLMLAGVVLGAARPLTASDSLPLLGALAGIAVILITSWKSFRRFTFLFVEALFRQFYDLAVEKNWLDIVPGHDRGEAQGA